jgi:hypothetical protein
MSVLFVVDEAGVALNVGLDVSIDNTYDSKGIREKAEEVNSTKAYITNDQNSL